MKKTLLTVLLLALCTTAHAAQNCSIEWWGDRTGSVPTTETSRTITATGEAFHAIFPTAGSPVCSNVDDLGEFDLFFCGSDDFQCIPLLFLPKLLIPFPRALE